MSPMLEIVAGLVLATQAVAEGSVLGVVRDGASGEALPGAAVTLADIERVVVTDARGRYVFTAVPAGPQHLAVRRIGYAARTLHALVPRRGELVIDVALQREPYRLHAVEVRPRVTVRGVDDDEGARYPDRGITLSGIRDHPQLAEPDALLALAGGEVAMRPESPSGVSVRGAASDQTAYLLDGIPVFSPYHAAGTFAAWNPDALERLDLASATPSPGLPDVLGGVVSATTRAAGERVRVHGAASNAQARLTVDGPVGAGGAGYLVAARASFPGALEPPDESSYLHGEAGDVVAKVELPVFGGTARGLAYGSGNALDVAAAADGGDPASIAASRNAFRWQSRSLGAGWSGAARGVALRVLGWGAEGVADATWDAGDGSPLRLASRRHDVGALVVAERNGDRAATIGGIRFERSRTSYATATVSAGSVVLPYSERAETPIATAFIGHRRRLGPALELDGGLSVAGAAGGIHLGPRARLEWIPLSRLSLSASWDRSHQYAQSLRNPESVAGVVFPVDLFVGAGGSDVPVASANRVVLAGVLQPTSGVRLGAQAYRRDFEGVLLVAAQTGGPFATGDPLSGAGSARGVSLELAASGERYGVLLGYGWQNVTLRHEGLRYTPEHAAAHVFEAGATLHPSATSSIRIGMTGMAGRRATRVAGALEWESCNLLDWGCEFGGSPRADSSALGATRLPVYARLDIGARKHWHLRVEGRDALVALYATVTNVLGRQNVLTVAEDPETGRPAPIGMRPLAPLVVGVEWRF